MEKSIRNLTNVVIGDVFKEKKTHKKIMFQCIQKRECKPKLLIFADTRTNEEVVMTESMFYTTYITTNKLVAA